MPADAVEHESLDLGAQREACEAYIKSQAHEGWRLVPDRYDDGGLSGASLDRPALQKLLADVRAGKITIVVVYKVDRLTRSLADFAKLVELDMPAEKPRHEVLGEGGRRRRPEGDPPQGAKFFEAERPHAVDLGLDRLAIRCWMHAGHAALRPDLPLRFDETSFATMR
jgi:Resolvase, N terminal domain